VNESTPHIERRGRTIICTLTFGADAAKVFDLLEHVERWTDWNPNISKVELLDGTPLRVGSAARVTQPKLGTATWRVTELHRPAEFVWTSTRTGVSTIGGHRVEQLGDEVRLTLTIEQRGPMAWLIAPFVRRLTESYISGEATALREQST
jgi:hypothetical protein